MFASWELKKEHDHPFHSIIKTNFLPLAGTGVSLWNPLWKISRPIQMNTTAINVLNNSQCHHLIPLKIHPRPCWQWWVRRRSISFWFLQKLVIYMYIGMKERCIFTRFSWESMLIESGSRDTIWNYILAYKLDVEEKVDHPRREELLRTSFLVRSLIKND